MSQEERDLRLELTGLSSTERAKRIAELERFLEEKTAAARAKLEKQRAARRARQQGEAEQPVDNAADQP